MNSFVSVGIVFLAMLIQASMQLMPGVFAASYHASLGKTSAKKADDICLSFILGAEIFTAVIFLAIYTIVSVLSIHGDFAEGILPWVMVGIFVAEALACLLPYYRRGKSSELFIPRRAAKNLLANATHAKSRTDTILLGALSGVFELPFTLPLYIIIAYLIVMSRGFINFAAAILFIISAILPLFVVRTFFRSGLNLADIIRLRVKNKTFFRLLLSISYLLLAALLITKEIL